MAESPPSLVSNGQNGEELIEGSAVGRFRIGKRVGRGGMGEVYQAQDMRRKRLVAVKRLAPSLRRDPLYRRRFLEEAGARQAPDSPACRCDLRRNRRKRRNLPGHRVCGRGNPSRPVGSLKPGH